MKRKSSHSLKFITGKKKELLNDFFDEYMRVVNAFIDLFWDAETLPYQINSNHYHQIDSWLLGKAMKCAGNQALKIIKSTWKKNNEINYKVYKRVYKKLIKKEKIHPITTIKWRDWIKTVTLRKRINKPVFKGQSIELNSDLVTIYDDPKVSSFDLMIRLGSVFGNRYSLFLPSKQHKQNNQLIEKGFGLRKSIRLTKNHLGNYVVDLFWEKKTLEPKQEGDIIGVDIGINKLMSLSDGTFIGDEIKDLLEKLNGRKQKSKNWYQTLEEIKCYINKCAKEISFKEIKTLVIENLKNITKNTKGRTSKKLRKQLGHWNLNLLRQRLSDHCELNRVNLVMVDPAYTSQTCSFCGHVSRKSRKGESFDCVKCGFSLDADHNAAINIQNLFLNGESTAPHEQKLI